MLSARFPFNLKIYNANRKSTTKKQKMPIGRCKGCRLFPYFNFSASKKRHFVLILKMKNREMDKTKYCKNEKNCSWTSHRCRSFDEWFRKWDNSFTQSTDLFECAWMHTFSLFPNRFPVSTQKSFIFHIFHAHFLFILVFFLSISFLFVDRRRA